MSQENVNCVLSANRRKQFAECELELIVFGQDVIATSGDDIGGAHNSWLTGGGNDTTATSESGNVGIGPDGYGQGA